jgi:hypothetical protein
MQLCCVADRLITSKPKSKPDSSNEDGWTKVSRKKRRPGQQPNGHPAAKRTTGANGQPQKYTPLTDEERTELQKAGICTYCRDAVNKHDKRDCPKLKAKHAAEKQAGKSSA